MTLLFMDGMYYPTEDILYRYSQTHDNVSMSTTTRRTGPGSIRLAISLFPYGEIAYSLPVNADILVVGFAFKPSGTPTSIYDQLQFFPVSGYEPFIRFHSDFSISARHGTSGSDIVYGTSDPAILSNNIWSYIEVKIKNHTTNGFFIVHVNGVEVINFSGAMSSGDGSDFAKIQWNCDTACTQYIQDLYICDGLTAVDADPLVPNNDFLGDSKVEIMRPNAPGTHTDFDPSAGANHENVDEVGVDGDTTYNQSNVVGAKDTYNLNDITVTGATIFGIQQQSIVRKTDASVRYGKQILKSGAVESLSDERQFNDTFTAYHKILEIDPDTDDAWDEAGTNALESGLTVTL